MGGIDSGGSGEDEGFAVFGELHSWFDGGFGANEELIGVFGAKIA